MPITTGNFDDLVQLSQDTLYYVGPDLEIGNTSVGSTASVGFNNTAGKIALVGVATANVTVSLPAGGGQLNPPVNLSAGTQLATSGTVSFSNSNGVSFGMSNSSVLTAVFGGLSNWQNGAPITTFASSSAFVSFQPIVLPYAMTVTDVLFLASVSQGTSSSGSSGGINVSIGLYTLSSTGTAGTLSLLSSASTFSSWTSGGPYSSQSGVGLRQMSVASWSLTPGPYMFAMALASTVLSSISVTLYGTASLASVGASGFGTALSSMAWVPGYSVSSVTALPASVAVSNTASFVRTGGSLYQQAWISFQGT